MLDKSNVFNAIQNELEAKISRIQAAFDDLQSALASNTKSSAGDKHETGRAMAQLEQEKLSGQLSQLITMKKSLSAIDPLEKHDTVKYGSLVKTNQGVYFFSVGLGKIEVGAYQIFCLTATTPFGKMLMGKRKGDEFIFNANKNAVLDVL